MALLPHTCGKGAVNRCRALHLALAWTSQTKAARRVEPNLLSLLFLFVFFSIRQFAELSSSMHRLCLRAGSPSNAAAASKRRRMHAPLGVHGERSHPSSLGQ